MTDREISYVSTIARCGSITQAAEQLFIAQPSLTQALHRIEAEYGTVFFHRRQGVLRLTAAGQAYLNPSNRRK
ncbi:MAG: LysR family transcriptional regulator, partial [Dysosmobacter sp.]|nr:LysR family transcriptional regulator [Dysosmobacter sp.]